MKCATDTKSEKNSNLNLASKMFCHSIFASHKRSLIFLIMAQEFVSLPRVKEHTVIRKVTSVKLELASIAYSITSFHFFDYLSNVPHGALS